MGCKIRKKGKNGAKQQHGYQNSRWKLPPFVWVAGWAWSAGTHISSSSLTSRSADCDGAIRRTGQPAGLNRQVVDRSRRYCDSALGARGPRNTLKEVVAKKIPGS